MYKYAPVATGRPNAVVPSGKDFSWLTLIPMSNKARASHCHKKNQPIQNMEHYEHLGYEHSESQTVIWIN